MTMVMIVATSENRAMTKIKEYLMAIVLLPRLVLVVLVQDQ